ncbi:MAG: enoyl-CoA hydratase/isomerase family protein [Candidatus Heimdallarchaeota archaeon]|nr:enoyl-CoA hydratase/isomerase family protein [Candidatus Heimdallarchaeota archaeon]
MVKYETINSEIKDYVCIITLNRAQVHNAFNPVMISELTSEFLNQSTNPLTRVIVLTGKGKSFSAGADLGYMQSTKEFTIEENQEDARNLEKLFHTIYQTPKPVVGRINGAAFGGGVGLVSLCDISIAVEGTIFAFSEVNLGIMPAVISPYVIPKIGMSQATRYFLTGERFNAETALKIGLIHEITPSLSELDQKLDEILVQLLASGPAAMAQIKRILDKYRTETLDVLRPYLIDRIADIRISPEGKEGLSAFLERRDPKWKIKTWNK